MRLSDDVKIIVGTYQKDNELREARAHAGDFRITCPDLPGPVAIAPAALSEDPLRLAASICARHTKNPAGTDVKVEITKGDEARTMHVEPLNPEAVRHYLTTH